jgi:hypothetical protein
MDIKKVAKLSSEERFFYWIEERHNMWIRREQKKQPKPWTDDEVLRSFFFTNPYRENDKTTVWFRENIRDPQKNKPEVVFNTIFFRWFNLISTGEVLLKNGLFEKWTAAKTKKLLRGKQPMFTGAFMIPAVPGTKKLDHVCNCLKPIWKDRNKLAVDMRNSKSMEESHKMLLRYPYMGGFMAYEIITDLRHTKILRNAKDIMTWCNPGPGASRGTARLAGESMKGIPAAHGHKAPKDFLKTMRKLLKKANYKLGHLPPFEMREIEHSLCEWDKYERARLQDGRMKRKYQGV